MFTIIPGMDEDRIRAEMKLNTYAYGIVRSLNEIEPRFKWDLYNANGFSGDLIIHDGLMVHEIPDCVRIYMADVILDYWNSHQYDKVIDAFEDLKRFTKNGMTNMFGELQLLRIHRSKNMSARDRGNLESSTEVLWSKRIEGKTGIYGIGNDGPAMLREIADYIENNETYRD